MNKYLENLYKIISNSFYFKILYLLVSLSYITLIFQMPIFKFLNKICLVWGALLFLINFIQIIMKKRKIYIYNIFLYIFLAVTLFFTIYKYPTTLNFKTWIINLLILTVIFSIDNYKTKKELIKEIDIYSYLYLAFTFISSTISIILLSLKLNIEKLIINADGVEELITFKGIFNNENAFGISAAISILISLYMISKARNSKLKTLLIINSIIQFIALIFSGGRSGYLALLSLAFIFAFIYIKNNIVRALLIILPILSLVFIFTLDSSTLHYIFTGREYIWIAAIRIIKFSFFSGIGTSNTIPTLIQNQPADLIGVTKGGIHNIYMEVTTTNGFIATFMLILFITSVIIYGTHIISKMKSREKITYTILLSILVAIPVINLMESSLVYIISFISLIYWFYAGHFISIMNIEKDRY
ncbi:hypothetical protein [Clostridium tertium]|uniref:O-Antigen ligase n=1 Tax=Clostridium tertium TaxID=1559 RepID=A0A6N3F9F8_9CLOT